MRIGVFGGSFNPPHKIHRQIVEMLKVKGYVDKVIVVPTGTHYEYKNNLVKNQYRLDMLHLLFQDLDYVTISTYEMKAYPVYTYQTLEYYQRCFPYDEIYFICGMDNLSYIHTWKHPEIIAKFPLLVLTRGERRFSNPDFKATIISFEHANISSTLVRDKLRQNESVLAFVPKTIEDYILKYQLYRE